MNESYKAPETFPESEVIEARKKAQGVLNDKIKGKIKEIQGLTDEEKDFVERISGSYKETTKANAGIPKEFTITDPADMNLYRGIVDKIASASLHEMIHYDDEDRFFNFSYTTKLVDIIRENADLLSKEIGSRYGLLMDSAWYIKNDSWGKDRKGGGKTITKDDFIKAGKEVEEVLKKHALL